MLRAAVSQRLHRFPRRQEAVLMTQLNQMVS